MNKLGVSPFWLLSDGVTKPVTVLSYVVQLGQFKMETRTALKKTELVFKINEDFIEITADGRRATSKELWLCATWKQRYFKLYFLQERKQFVRICYKRCIHIKYR